MSERLPHQKSGAKCTRDRKADVRWVRIGTGGTPPANVFARYVCQLGISTRKRMSPPGERVAAELQPLHPSARFESQRRDLAATARNSARSRPADSPRGSSSGYYCGAQCRPTDRGRSAAARTIVFACPLPALVLEPRPSHRTQCPRRLNRQSQSQPASAKGFRTLGGRSSGALEC